MDTVAFFKQLKTDLLAWARSRPDVCMIKSSGSQTRLHRPADEYSDLDLDVIVDDNQIDDHIEWMLAYAPVWVTILEVDQATERKWLILYQGAYKVDFSISLVSELQKCIDEQRLWTSELRGYEVWLDRDGIAGQLPQADRENPPPYTPPTEAAFVQDIGAFFYGAIYIAKQLRRENLWKAKWADHYQHESLLRMLEWRAHALHDGPLETWHNGDYMQDWVDAATWDEIHRIFSHFDAEDTLKALRASIVLYTRLAKEAANKLGYTYPQVLVDEMNGYIEDLHT